VVRAIVRENSRKSDVLWWLSPAKPLIARIVFSSTRRRASGFGNHEELIHATLRFFLAAL